MIITVEWEVYRTIIRSATIVLGYYKAERRKIKGEEKILYVFYAELSTGNMIKSIYECDTIEDAIMFEESFIKSNKDLLPFESMGGTD